jgi:sialidase-1
MRNQLLLFTVGFASCAGALQSAAAAEPMLAQVDLFSSGQDDVNIYRIPALLTAPSGTLLAFIEARAGDDGDPTDLTLKRSVYAPAQEPRMLNGYPRVFGYGVNWEPMRTVLPGKGGAIMNPCPVIDRSTGRIWLPCYEVLGHLTEHLKDPYKGRILLTWSDDEGLTWAPPRDLTGDVPRFIPGPGVGLQLRSGRLVIPGYWAPAANVPSRSCVIYSDDHGQTWHQGAQVIGNTDESQAAELSDGTLLLNCRSNRGKGCRYVARSRDGGQTWFEEYDDAALPEPVCQASLLSLPQADAEGAKPWLVFVNPVRGRTTLTARVSTDDGKTWSAGRVIHPGHAAYTGMALLKDGTIGVLYETGPNHPYEKVTFARFNLEWLTAP